MGAPGAAESNQPRGVAGAVGLSAPRAMCAAAATGFGVMAAELTAVRLLAPHFGDSAYVWTNVIGVILAAMALGAALGGRLSARAQTERWPRTLLLAGALLLAAAPFIASWCGEAMMLSGLPLDAAMPALIRGSLVVSALVFAPPMLLLWAAMLALIENDPHLDKGTRKSVDGYIKSFYKVLDSSRRTETAILKACIYFKLLRLYKKYWKFIQD